jgi:uncharacterized Tic20 family protein
MEALKLTKDGKIKLPQPNDITKKEKEDAMGAYLMMFAALAFGLPLPIISLIASFIYYFINKKKSRFVAFHSHQALISQLFISLLNAMLVTWLIVILVYNVKRGANYFNDYFYLFLAFTIIWNLIYFIVSIVACVKANQGRFFYMLFFGRISFNKFYSKKEAVKKKSKTENLPPR